MKVFIIEIDDYYKVHIYGSDEKIQQLITEAKDRGVPLGGPYWAKDHHPHTPEGEYHLHLYDKRGQLAAINRSGSAHHRSNRGFQLPNRVADAIKKVFPDYRIPSDNIIESITQADQLMLIVENANYEMLFLE